MLDAGLWSFVQEHGNSFAVHSAGTGHSLIDLSVAVGKIVHSVAVGKIVYTLYFYYEL